MLRDIDAYFQQQEEPVKSCLLFLRGHILRFDPHIREAWKYRMPFYEYKGKMCCYLWTHKKNGQPYLGIVEGQKLQHPHLIQEKRARMKIMPFDPHQDIPLELLDSILRQMLMLYGSKP